MSDVNVQPRAVISRIACKLRDRMLKVDGQGEMVNDLQGRVLMRRPSYDADNEKVPSAFIRVRTITRAKNPSDGDFWDVAVVFDVIMIVEADDNETLAGIEAKADVYRAIEIKGDEYLRDDDCGGANLLNQELAIVDAQIEDLQDAMTFDMFGVGVQCTFPQKYGDPNHVQR